MTSPRQLREGNTAVFQHDEFPHTPVEVPSARDLFDSRSAADNRPGRCADDNRPGSRCADDNRPGSRCADDDNRPGSRCADDNRPGSRCADDDNRPGSRSADDDNRPGRQQQEQDRDTGRTARRFLEERRKMAARKARRQLRSRMSRETSSFLLKHKRTIIGTSFAVGSVVGLAAVVGILATGNTEPETTTTPPTTTLLPPTLAMSNVSFFEGEDLSLPCRITGNEIIYEVLFFKDGIQVKDGFSIEVSGRQYALTKKGATCSDSGQYECQATGDFGILNMTSMVNISSKPCNPTLEDAWQIILKNISIYHNNLTQQDCSSSSVHCGVPQACNGTSSDAASCCYLIDNGGKTLHLKGCDNVTFAADVSPCDCTTDRVAVPRPTTYPDNCNLYYTCSGGVKQDATCTGGDIFSADPSVQACTASPDDSYCAKVNAGEIRACSVPVG
ncbi:uncharacterized protein [Haliotis asinina]|uniref:uncharacterized protein n=1 Tax=Haliotis asinina TaxID=109174 RepID=UPI003531F515